MCSESRFEIRKPRSAVPEDLSLVFFCEEVDACRSAQKQEKAVNERRKFDEPVERPFPSISDFCLRHRMASASYALCYALFRNLRALQRQIDEPNLISLLLRMLDYAFVFVAAKDCFDGYIFSGIDAFDNLGRNLIRRPVVGRIPCDTRIARVVGLSSVVRIQKPYLATWEEFEGVLEIRRACESGFTSTIWTGDEEEPSQERKLLAQSVSRILVF